MPKKSIVTKDLTLISELMLYEQLAYKKCELYASTLSNPTLANNCKQIAANHKARFESLLANLNAHE